MPTQYAKCECPSLWRMFLAIQLYRFARLLLWINPAFYPASNFIASQAKSLTSEP